jgi:hypothetical protein
MASSSSEKPAHPIAAVDVQRLRGDVIGIRRRQERRRLAIIVGNPIRPKRYGFADQPLLLADQPIHVFGEQRIDMARTIASPMPRASAVTIATLSFSFIVGPSASLRESSGHAVIG